MLTNRQQRDRDEIVAPHGWRGPRRTYSVCRDVETFTAQCPRLVICYGGSFHVRFPVVDSGKCCHIDASRWGFYFALGKLNAGLIHGVRRTTVSAGAWGNGICGFTLDGFRNGGGN